MKTLSTLLLLCLTSSMVLADVPDDGIVRPAERSGFYVGFANKETGLAELAWQMMNVVDTLQTLQIAKNPECYQEVGQLALISGSHPSTREVYFGMALFGVGHYLIAKGIDHLVTQNPDYMVVQRVYQYLGSAYKAYTISNNASIGLDLDHSRSCLN